MQQSIPTIIYVKIKLFDSQKDKVSIGTKTSLSDIKNLSSTSANCMKSISEKLSYWRSSGSRGKFQNILTIHYWYSTVVSEGSDKVFLLMKDPFFKNHNFLLHIFESPLCTNESNTKGLLKCAILENSLRLNFTLKNSNIYLR